MFHWRRVSEGQSGGDRCRAFEFRLAQCRNPATLACLFRGARYEVVNAKA
jgi:hypothetical protein